MGFIYIYIVVMLLNPIEVLIMADMAGKAVEFIFAGILVIYLIGYTFTSAVATMENFTGVSALAKVMLPLILIFGVVYMVWKHSKK